MNGWFDLRWPRGGIAFFAGCCIFAGAVFLVIDSSSQYSRFMGLWFLPLGIGLWLKHSWARWTAFVFLTLITVLCILVFVKDGVSVKSAIRFMLVLATLHSLWEWNVYPSFDDDVVSQLED
ncbi:MAG: hypothetical protein COA78_37625 [Blastopirellula sp.]|nr:MAG: hypothetical protein COA78_37625 [Blastopirellula sp.]